MSSLMKAFEDISDEDLQKELDYLNDIGVCDNYFGNACSGFGAKTICSGCNKGRYDHFYKEELEKVVAERKNLKWKEKLGSINFGKVK